MKSVAWFLCMVFVLTVTVGPLAAADEPKVDWGEEYIKARGLGSFKGAPSSRKLVIAREKAKMRAERDLLGIIYKLNIDSETTLKETMDTEEYSEVITKQIKGTLKGAKVLAEGQLNNNTYEVIMGVRFAEVRKAALCNKDVKEEEEAAEQGPIIIPSRNFMALGDPGITNLDYMTDPRYSPPAGQPAATLPVPTAAPVAMQPTVTQPAVTAQPTHGTVTVQVTDSAPTAATPAEPTGPMSDDDLDAALVGALPSQTVDTVVEPGPMPTEPFQPPTGHEDVQALPGQFTSLVVDARRLDADRAFWPRVLGPNQEVIYGNYDASVDFLQDEGAVAYCSSIAEAKSCNRCGDNPMIVKAVDVYGKYKADLVLSAEDAEKVKQAAVAHGFLAAYRVMFVLK